VLVDPAGHGGHEDLPELENSRHREIVVEPKIDRQLSKQRLPV
jgi:hypothetical protein